MSNSSLPESFVSRMQQQLATDFTAFRESMNSKSPVSIRLNPSKKFQHPATEKIAWATEGRYLNERPVFTLDPAFHAGAYYVQEASSMFLEQVIVHAVDASRPLLALDLCAAPGGKSTHLLSLLSHESFLVSNEVIRSRASILSENIQKWGYGNVVITNNDPEDFEKIEGAFDLIVVDAPCSGEGLFRKDIHAASEWSEDNAELCAQRQRRILNSIWPSLKNGGTLIYSTCTFNPAENEENLAWLRQQKETEFVSIPLKPEWGVEEINNDGIIGYRFYPHRVKGEGFFITAIRKRSEQHTANLSRRKSTMSFLSQKRKEILKGWFKNEEQLDLIEQQELIIAIPASWRDEIDWLSQHLRVITKGTAIATLKHDKPIPEQAFALSNHINLENFSQHELSLSDAQHYLKKDVLNFPAHKKGFQLVMYQQLPLGWINHLGNRINNLYPTAWRIKMEVGPYKI